MGTGTQQCLWGLVSRDLVCNHYQTFMTMEGVGDKVSGEPEKHRKAESTEILTQQET